VSFAPVALVAMAAGLVLPPVGDDPVPYTPPPIVVCHESAVVPSTATYGIGSTVVCQSRGVVAG
jgi:hypothetical protein